MSVALLAALLSGCGPAPGEPSTLLIARHPELLAHVALPEHSHAVAPPTSSMVPLTGVQRTEESGEVALYVAPLPFAHVIAGHSTRFQPAGMTLEGRTLRWSTGREAHTWHLEDGRVEMRLPADAPAIADGDIQMSYVPAWEDETRLHLATSGATPRDVALGTVRHGSRRLHGVYLPAPAEASWDLTAPRSAVLYTEVGLLRPPIARGVGSNGATVVVEALHDGQVVVTRERRLDQVGKLKRMRVDLSRLGGRPFTLRIRTEPDGDTAHDHVFLAEPAVYTPDAAPRRLVLVFIDTLRPDHLGAYGYTRRPTSPTLDALASSSVVFDHARSVSPWTLPTTRAVLTGRQPEDWDGVPHLAEHLAAHGWATEAAVTNAFLSEEFGMGRGWSSYGYNYLRPARAQVDWARWALQRHADRDLALLVHFMEPHLPYMEPPAYRRLWAGEPPEGLRETFGARDLWPISRPVERKRLRPYLHDRYDQNIRYLDDQLGPLLDAAGPDATVVVFSDHGEEFWEHGGLEHGHAVFDEVMRVPLIVRSPGLAPARVEAPVSLIDLAPTLLDLLGVPPLPETSGRSLVGAMRGDSDSLRALAERPIAFGRTLRGADAYGVVRGHDKWIFRRGRLAAFDLTSDPGERSATRRPVGGSRPPAADLLAQGLGRPVVEALRLSGPDPQAKAWSDPQARLTVRLPGGFRQVWPASSSPETPLELGPDQLVVGPGPAGVPMEVWLVPTDPTVIDALELEVTDGDETWTGRGAETPGAATPLVQAGRGPSRYEIHWDVVPTPSAQQVPTHHPARTEELRALGYVE